MGAGRSHDFILSVAVSRISINAKQKFSVKHKLTGIKTTDDINQFVIHKSKIKILSTTKTIQEIAYDLGFSQPHYFIKLYNNITLKSFRE